MGTNETPDAGRAEEPNRKGDEEEKALDDGWDEDFDADAPTVIMNKAIDPAIFANHGKVDAESKKGHDEDNEQDWDEDSDDDAPTVIMNKAIDPAFFANERKVDPEETHVIISKNAKDPMSMSDEELNRIVDEVGKYGAIPMDRLPSEVGKKKPDDEKKS